MRLYKSICCCRIFRLLQRLQVIFHKRLGIGLFFDCFRFSCFFYSFRFLSESDLRIGITRESLEEQLSTLPEQTDSVTFFSNGVSFSNMIGNSACTGHTECDSIIMDHGRILAVPGLEANNVDAALVHEAAIGKIAGDQIIKLMTLGLTEQEAEEQIVNGFLK